MTDQHRLSLGGLQIVWDDPAAGTVQIQLHGDLDRVTVPVFQEVLETLYAQECFVVRMDLTRLDFIDSSGLGAMVGAWRHCRDHEGGATASGPKVSVRRLMDMTGISTFLLAGA